MPSFRLQSGEPVYSYSWFLSLGSLLLVPCSWCFVPYFLYLFSLVLDTYVCFALGSWLIMA